jgi:hypothetical protein
MIERRIRCNGCAIEQCTIINNVPLARKCIFFAPLPDFKTPLLVHLMDDNKAINTTKVLAAVGFKIEEIGTYPYFRLYTK